MHALPGDSAGIRTQVTLRPDLAGQRTPNSSITTFGSQLGDLNPWSPLRQRGVIGQARPNRVVRDFRNLFVLFFS